MSLNEPKARVAGDHRTALSSANRRGVRSCSVTTREPERIETGDWLVQEQQFGVMQARVNQRKLPAVAGRELTNVPIAIRVDPFC